MIFRFPIEIVLKVLEYFPQIDIEYFQDRLPENDPIQQLLVQKLHKRVLVNYRCVDQSGFIVKEEDEMRSKVLENVPMQRIEFIEKGLKDPWFI